MRMFAYGSGADFLTLHHSALDVLDAKISHIMTWALLEDRLVSLVLALCAPTGVKGGR
jgi:hypothetical protein